MNRLTSATAAILFIASLGVLSCGSPPSPIPSPTTMPSPAPEPSVPAKPTGWISFDSQRDGYWGIYLIRADGSGSAAPLTAHLNGEYWSAWSPDGTRLAFSSLRDSAGSDGNSSIYTIGIDGTDLARITYNKAKESMPAWSPDGKEIAFASDRESGNWDIYTIDTTGIGLKRLTADPAADEWPSWSPDGGRLAFHSVRSGDTQIYVMNADGTEVEPLTRNPGTIPNLGIQREEVEDRVLVSKVVEGGPADLAGILPGDLILAVDGAPAALPAELRGLIETHKPGDEVSVTVNRKGKELILPLRMGTAPQPNAYPAWSPNGRQIAFASPRDGDWEIYVMNADGSDQKSLTANDARDLYPAWSPDGQYIAFSSDRSGNLDVYVMKADGSDVTQLTDHTTNEYPPRWSPAGAAVADEPRFGPPFCLRDTDDDGNADVSTVTFPQDDKSLFVSFPYANMRDDLPWSVDLTMDKVNPLSFSEPWGERESGILTVRFSNWTAYSIDVQGIHGSAIGPFPPGALTVQLKMDGRIVQEMRCQVVGR